MRPNDLSDLIQGALVVIFLSLAFGKYGQLTQWARTEALGTQSHARIVSYGTR